jgi:acetyl esterase/lipase
MADGAAVLRWTRDNARAFGGDPDRIFLMGHSAGAHIAVLLSLDPRYLAEAGLDRRAVRGTIGLAGPYDFLPLASSRLRAVFGQDIGADLAPTQPINFADGDAPPMLLATGDDDNVVYPRNTIRLAQKLRAAGGHVEEALYPGVGHYAILLALARPTRGFAPVLDDAERFIRAR